MLGRIVHIQIGNSAASLTNLAKERSAVLSVNTTSLPSSSAMRGHTNHVQKRSWSVKGDMILDESQFVELFNAWASATSVTLQFGNLYRGNAYVESISITAAYGELIKSSVTFIGNGKLDYLI